MNKSNPDNYWTVVRDDLHPSIKVPKGKPLTIMSNGVMVGSPGNTQYPPLHARVHFATGDPVVVRCNTSTYRPKQDRYMVRVELLAEIMDMMLLYDEYLWSHAIPKEQQQL